MYVSIILKMYLKYKKDKQGITFAYTTAKQLKAKKLPYLKKKKKGFEN